MLEVYRENESHLKEFIDTLYSKEAKFEEIARAKQKTEDSDEFFREYEHLVGDAESYLSGMEVSIDAVGPAGRQEAKAKINGYRREVTKYKKKLMKALEDLQHIINQENLFGDAENQKKVLLEGDLVISQNEKLKDAIRVGYQTQEVAFSSEVELSRNTETMKRSLSSMGGIHKELSWSNKLLGDIRKNMSNNKYVLWAVFAFIAIIFLLLVLVKIFL